MQGYEVYLRVSLLDIVPKSGSRRQKIMDFIHRLREYPNLSGDFVERDTSFRDLQVKIVGEYAISYWLDEPAKAVMVINVQLAD